MSAYKPGVFYVVVVEAYVSKFVSSNVEVCVWFLLYRLRYDRRQDEFWWYTWNEPFWLLYSFGEKGNHRTSNFKIFVACSSKDPTMPYYVHISICNISNFWLKIIQCNRFWIFFITYFHHIFRALLYTNGFKLLCVIQYLTGHLYQS